MNHFDVVIIGSGTSGQTAAGELSAEGYDVALIEHSDKPGGVCALRGCQAKKWFYEVVELVARGHHLQTMGVTAPPQPNWRQILMEKNKFTSAVPENTVKNLRASGVAYLQGRARFLDHSTLHTGSETITARYFIIACGAKPVDLALEGHEHIITSTEFLDLEILPERIGFIGGGFVSFELGHFAARLGGRPGEIHILEANTRPLGPFDSDMVKQLTAASEADGIHIHTDVSVTAVVQKGSSYFIELKSGEQLEVDLVVNGAGRKPNIDSLNLEAAGVKRSKGGIDVDSSMRTSQPGIFAVGDCADSLKLARVADKEAQVAAGAIIAAEEGREIPQIDYRAVPAVLFTYPQLGMVGKTEEALIEDGIKFWKSYDTKLSWPTYKRLGMKYAAYKILVDENDLIVGAHFLSDNTTGVLNTFKQAMIDNIPISKLRDDNIMSPYPSRESDIPSMLSPLLE